jgi:hypothetical protein
MWYNGLKKNRWSLLACWIPQKNVTARANNVNNSVVWCVCKKKRISLLACFHHHHATLTLSHTHSWHTKGKGYPSGFCFIRHLRKDAVLYGTEAHIIDWREYSKIQESVVVTQSVMKWHSDPVTQWCSDTVMQSSSDVVYITWSFTRQLYCELPLFTSARSNAHIFSGRAPRVLPQPQLARSHTREIHPQTMDHSAVR